MSGSGSAVFGIFDSPELCEWAAAKLKKITKDVFVTATFDPKEGKDGWFFSKNLYSLD